MTAQLETTVAERTAQALEFMNQAEFEFAVGDTRQGAEKLYGAAVQAIIAASRQRGWDFESHRANKNAAKRGWPTNTTTRSYPPGSQSPSGSTSISITATWRTTRSPRIVWTCVSTWSAY